MLDNKNGMWYNVATSASRLFCFARMRQAERLGQTLPDEGGTRTFPCGKVKYFEMGGAAIMANDARVKITLVCTECKQRNYDTKKNKKNDPDRLELKKFCRFCRKHTLHKESK